MPLEEKYVYIEMYKKVVHSDGVRTTIEDHRFEIHVDPHSDIWEQQAVQLLREWIRNRKKTVVLR